MSSRAQGTQQVNLKLTPAHEEIVRLLVQRLREGGLEFEARVRSFVSDPPVPRYMHINELDDRFGEIERRIRGLEEVIAATGVQLDPDSKISQQEREEPNS